MKKRIFIAAVLVLVISLAAYGTMAYLTAKETAHNIITAGSIQVELLDKTQPERTAGMEEDFSQWPDFTAVYPNGMAIMPGTEASKLVAVKKLEGSADCWVRVRIMDRMVLADGSLRELSANEVGMDLDLTHWIESADGWYYYRTPLTSENPTTAPLFTTVSFSAQGMGNEYQGASYSIEIEAQAVQSDHNTPSGDSWTVDEIKGWPAASSEASSVPEEDGSSENQ